MVWLFFAILAPVCWALANPLDSSLRRNYIKNDAFLTWVSSLAKLPVAIVLLLVFSEGFTWGWHVPGMFLTGFLWMLPFIFYYKALQFEETSRVILITQFMPVFIFIIAAIFIGERLDLQQSTAFVLIFAGSLMAAMRRHESKWHFSKAFILMALAALGWAVSDVMFKQFASGFPNFWQAFGVDVLGSSLPAILFILMPRQRVFIKDLKHVGRKGWTFFVMSALMGVVGSLSFAYALTLEKASLVAVIAGLQPLFVLIFGFVLSLIFKEIPKESLKPGDLLLKVFSLILVVAGLAYLNL